MGEYLCEKSSPPDPPSPPSPPAPPPSPAPSPPPPPRGALIAVDLDVALSGLIPGVHWICSPYKSVLVYNQGLNAPAYGMLFAAHENDARPDWSQCYDGTTLAPTDLNAAVDMAQLAGEAPSTINSVQVGSHTTSGGDNVLCVYHDGLCCTAHYRTTSTNFLSAINFASYASSRTLVFDGVTGHLFDFADNCVLAPAPPSPPHPPSPPPPMIVSSVDLVPGPNNQHAGMQCNPHNTALLFEWGVNAPDYPLLYSRQGSGDVDSYESCMFTYGTWPNPHLWEAVKLPGSVAPMADGLTTTDPTFGTIAYAGDHYLCVDHTQPPQGFSTPRCCLAFYYTGATDFAAAYAKADQYWPLFNGGGGNPFLPNCDMAPPPSPPPPSPSPPPPFPPPPSPVGDVTVVNLEAGPNNEHAGMQCTPDNEALLFADGQNAPPYPLLFSRNDLITDAPNYRYCAFAYGTTGNFGDFHLVKLPTSSVPDDSVGGTFGTLEYDGDHYLCVNHVHPRPGFTTPKCCLAYYHMGASDFSTAYSKIEQNWPLFGTSGQPFKPECVTPSPPPPSPSPPPPSPSPPPSPHPPPPWPPTGEVIAVDLEEEVLAAYGERMICEPHKSVLVYHDGANAPPYGLLYAGHSTYDHPDWSTCDDGTTTSPKSTFEPVQLPGIQSPSDINSAQFGSLSSGDDNFLCVYHDGKCCTAYYRTAVPLVDSFYNSATWAYQAGQSTLLFDGATGHLFDWTLTCSIAPSPSPPPSPVPLPPPPSPSPSPSPPPLYEGGGCGFHTTSGAGSNAGVSTFFGQDWGLTQSTRVDQPILGSGTSLGTGFTMEIFTDDQKWIDYAATLDPINDAYGNAAAVLYYQLSYTSGGSGATSAVVTNARCKEMCDLWSECVTYEYFRYDGSKPAGTRNPDGSSSSATGANKLMRCELWVHPDGDHLTSARLGARPDDVWCGAAGGGMHDDTSRTPQNWPDLESKPDVPWPPVPFDAATMAIVADYPDMCPMLGYANLTLSECEAYATHHGLTFEVDADLTYAKGCTKGAYAGMAVQFGHYGVTTTPGNYRNAMCKDTSSRRRLFAGELPAPQREPPLEAHHPWASTHRKLTDLQALACNRLMHPSRAGGRYGVDRENGCFVSYFNLQEHNRPNLNPLADRDARSVGIDPGTGEWISSFMCVLAPWAPPPSPPMPTPPLPEPPPPPRGIMEIKNLESELLGWSAYECTPDADKNVLYFDNNIDAPGYPLLYAYDTQNNGGASHCQTAFNDRSAFGWPPVRLLSSLLPDVGTFTDPTIFGVLANTENGATSYYLTIASGSYGYPCLAYYRSGVATANAAFAAIDATWPAFRVGAGDVVDPVVPNCATPCKTQNQPCTYGMNQCCSPLICDENPSLDEDQCMTSNG